LEEKSATLSSQINGWLDKHMARAAINAAVIDSTPELTRAELEILLEAQINSKETNGEYLEIYVGWAADGEACTATDWDPNPPSWIAYERGWYKQAATSAGNIIITEPYVDANTGLLCLTFARTIGPGTDVGVSAVDLTLQTLDNFVTMSNDDPERSVFIIDGNDNILIHPDNAYTPDKDGNFKKLSDIKNNGEKQFTVAGSIPLSGWRVISSESVKSVMAPVNNVIFIMIAIALVVLILVVVLLYLRIRGSIVKPIHAVINTLSEMSKGDTNTALSSSFTGEFGQLADSVHKINNAILEQSEAISGIASGDYSISYSPRSGKDVMGRAIADLLEMNNRVFSEINGATAQVSDSARQIANGAQSLAQGSTQQAAAVEQLSSSVNEIAQKTKENAEQANTAAGLSKSVRSNAEKGSARMDDMIKAVEEINEASRNIQKVIKVIDDIAFQTNILALNAAVEAARAGQHGKGFAVVAEEVRSLAAKSAAAASDTGALIADSMGKAELGAKIAKETAESLNEIVGGINESNAIVSNIAMSSGDQSLAISQINTGIDQVAQVVQQNSATSEESAATAEELSGQSSILEDLIGQFKLNTQSGRRPGLPAAK
jgi:methyl-accepting chemotaxis protein